MSPLQDDRTAELDNMEKKVDDKAFDAKSVEVGQSSTTTLFSLAGLRKALLCTAETRGIEPVAAEERTDKTGRSLITLWFTANCSILPISTGMSGTLVFGLSLQVSTLVIVFSTAVAMLPVAWLGTLGPKTGMRQVIQARYSFGSRLVLIMVLLQLATLVGYTIITAIISGQTITAVSEGSVSLAAGIVVTVIGALFVSFMGYKALHYFEQYSWIPSLFAIIVSTGLAGHTLADQMPVEAPTARSVVSFAALMASLALSWVALVSDFAVYISPSVPRYATFSYVYVGYCLATIPLAVLGATIGGAVGSDTTWADANNAYSVGGVMYAMTSSVVGFGKFIAVLLAFSVIGNTACSLYSISISLQSLHPWLLRVPRYVGAIVIAAIVIPIAIVAASNFYAALGNFLSVIGYWTSIYAGIALVEYHVFRKGDSGNFNPASWNVRKELPTGLAAVVTGALCVGLIVPSMDTVWYTGTFALTTGDMAMELSFVLSCILYVPLRMLDLRLFGR